MRSACAAPLQVRSGQLRLSDAWGSQVRADQDGLRPQCPFCSHEDDDEREVKSLDANLSRSVVGRSARRREISFWDRFVSERCKFESEGMLKNTSRTCKNRPKRVKNVKNRDMFLLVHSYPR